MMNWLRREDALERFFLFASPVLLLLIWEFLSRTQLIDARVFPAPTKVASIIWSLIQSGDLLWNTLVTIRRLVFGILFGFVPAVFLGIVMGLFRIPRAILNPLVQIVHALPRIALFPLILIAVGVSEKSYIIMVALGPFFAILVTTMAAVINLPPIYRRVAQSFGANAWQTKFWVIIPAALPVIIGGFRVGLGLALLGVIAVEFLNTNDGIGYIIWHSWQILSLGESMAGLMVVGLLGLILFQALDYFEHLATPWRHR